MNPPHLAFLGLGIMGGGMAHRLLAAGFPLTVYNRRRDQAAALVAAGARMSASPREAAREADVIISMVADDAASRSIWLGADGALAGARRGTLAIECSTLSIGWVRELAAAVAAAGSECLDAPVTGSKAAATAGELNFLVGGSEAAVSRARPVLAPMSRSIVHLGPTGSGALVKLVNNFVCGVQIAALAEAMTWLERAGADRNQAVAVLTAGAPGSPIVQIVAARMMAADFEPNFRLRLMSKDIGYALAEARAAGLHLATADAAHALFQRALAAGLGERDMAAIIEPLRAAAP